MFPDGKILIVEDEWVIALDIQNRLNKLGYQVVGIARDAVTALQLATQTPPDLVLMDIRLQGEVDGIQAAIQLRQQFCLPVVFLTAHADDATLNRALAAHPFGYIIKPVRDHDLNTTIQIALANHEAERRMEQAIQKEKELNEMKSQFVSIVSHEFRNPLSAIIVTFDLLEQQECQLSPAQRQSHLQRGKTIAKDMARLIDDVLVMGEVNQKQFVCQPAPLDLVQFCRSLIEDLQVTIGSQHRLVLKTQTRQEMDAMFCNLDPKLLSHILSNLLSNAIKYSPAGSEVQLEIARDLETVTFQVYDQGVGIPAADLMRLFTPFHRGTNVRQIPGTGLGLSIVKRCVDAHGGRITINSQVNIGTTITVVLQQY